AAAEEVSALAAREPNYCNRAPAFQVASALLAAGKLEGAAEVLLMPVRRMHAAAGAPPQAEVFHTTSAVKLRHDLEQLAYLRSAGALDVGDAVLQAYREAASVLPDHCGKVALPLESRAALAPTYCRLLHLASAPPLPGGTLN